LKMDLTEGSETSAKLNLTPGKYPKENIQVSEHGENLKSKRVDPCHRVIGHQQLADGADGLHTCRITANILHMRCCAAESLWSFRLWISAGV
jgi:hypothetical protein